MELGKIYEDVSVDEFHVKRDGESYLVSFEFHFSGEVISVNLAGVHDSDGLCEILSANRLWVEKSEGTQQEYGCYALGLSHDYFTEIVFDALS